jgi:hypothetical protein
MPPGPSETKPRLYIQLRPELRNADSLVVLKSDFVEPSQPKTFWLCWKLGQEKRFVNSLVRGLARSEMRGEKLPGRGNGGVAQGRMQKRPNAEYGSRNANPDSRNS